MKKASEYLREKWPELLHLAVLCVAVAFIARYFFVLSYIRQYAQACAELYTEEQTVLDTAADAFAENEEEREVSLQLLNDSYRRSMDSAVQIAGRWADYHSGAAKSTAEEDDESTDSETPDSLKLAPKAFVRKLCRAVSAETMELQIGDEEPVSVSFTDSTVSGISDAARQDLLAQLRYVDYAYSWDGNVCYVAIADGDLRLFACFDDDAALVDSVLSDSFIARLQQEVFGVGDGGCLYLLDTAADEIAESPDGMQMGTSCTEAGFTPDAQQSGACLVQKLWGETCLTCYRETSDGIVICAALREEALQKNVFLNAMVHFFVFLMALLALLLYVCVQLTARWGRGRVHTVKLGSAAHLDISLGLHMLPVIAAGVLITFGASVYSQQLVNLSLKNVQDISRLQQIHMDEERNTSLRSDLKLQSQTEYLDRLAMLNAYIDMDPGVLTTERLQQMAELLDLDSIDVYEGADYELIAATSSLGSASRDSDRTDFDEIMKGTAKNSITVLGSDGSSDSGSTAYRCQVVVRRTDGSGIISAVLTDANIATYLAEDGACGDILTMLTAAGDVYLSVDADTQTVTNSTVANWTGLNLTELGMKDSVLAGGYTGFQEIDGTDYFVTAEKNGTAYEIICSKTGTLLRQAYEETQSVPWLALWLMLALIIPAIICPGKFVPQGRQPDAPGEDWENEKTEEEQDTAARQLGKWSRMSPQERYLFLFRSLLMLCAFGVVALLIQGLVYGENSNQGNILRYIVQGGWDRGPNIFAVTDVVLLVSIGSIASWFVRSLLRIASSFFGRHSESIADILDGFIGYVFALAIFFYSLNLLGVEPAALATGAGVLGVVVGIGAQSLVGDILTGIFIVAENEFSKGDMVEIDGWLGRVTEIGIRTTKVRDIHGNVRIFNNSVIQSVINKSLENSIAYIEISVAYGEDLPHAEQVLKDNMKKLRRAVPLLTADPSYFGVMNLGSSEVVLGVRIACREEDLPYASVAVRRELKLILDENNIEIPFPQVVVHYGKETKGEGGDGAQ